MDDLIFYFDFFVEFVVVIFGFLGHFIPGSPILLLTTGFLVLGGAIGIFGRLLKKN